MQLRAVDISRTDELASSDLLKTLEVCVDFEALSCWTLDKLWDIVLYWKLTARSIDEISLSLNYAIGWADELLHSQSKV
jgi:hypothetical protein